MQPIRPAGAVGQELTRSAKCCTVAAGFADWAVSQTHGMSENMTSVETDIIATDFASHARCTPRRLSKSTVKPLHDRATVKAVGGPEATTVKVLYDEHAAALWRYALRLTGDRARAQDVVQETLLRAWQHPEFANDSERSPRAWLFAVARNMIIDERRSARFRYEVRTLDGVGALEGAGPDEMNGALDRLLIGDALARLTPEHREVIRRSYFDGWTTAQIAADLRIPDGTVKSRLHYALRALRLALGEMGFTP
jgi:RNA polymerase sigma-70 factor (ECF subfamily)